MMGIEAIGRLGRLGEAEKETGFASLIVVLMVSRAGSM
jgi:hypothetical protein